VEKSTLLDALIRRHVESSTPRKIRTLVHLAQSHTYGPLAIPEDNGTLTADENLRHLERIVGMIEWLHTSVQEHTPVVLCAGRHLVPYSLRSSGRGEVERRRTVRSAACRRWMQTALLAGNARYDWQRGIEPRTDQQFIQEYARKFGRTHEDIHSHFVREQKKLIELFSRSVMTKRLLQNDGTPDDTLEEALQFWSGDFVGEEIRQL
jgi:hypothetical protein